MTLFLEGHQIGFSKQLLMTDEYCFGISFIRLEFEGHPCFLFCLFLN